MPRTDPVATSWWARRWLSTLDSFGPEYKATMARGRAFARDGRVLRVAVRPGLIEAETLGSAHQFPDNVGIEVAPLAEAEWERVIAALAGNAAAVAQLLAGEVTPEIEEVFATAGASLFPRNPAEVQATCTCHDGPAFCKHVAATHYVLAANLDQQPALLLTLRGREIADLVAALRRRWSAEVGGPDVPTAPDASPSPADALTLPLRPSGFFRAGPELDAFSITIAPPQVEAALLKRLGRPPFASSDEDPLPALIQVYAAVTRRALQAFGRSGERQRQDGQDSPDDA